MSTLPKDPVMLLSFTNMKLRDECPNLTVFFFFFEIPCKELCERLAGIDYHYQEPINQFK